MTAGSVYTNVKKKLLVPAVLAVTTLLAAPAHAQLNGENLLGDNGIKSGTQPHPGVYVGNIYYRYFTESLKGPDGKPLVLDPTGEGQQTINAATPMVIYISKKKILGANFGMMAVMPFARGSLEAPGLGVSEEVSTGVSDAYIMPVQLGWHAKRADFVTGFAFFAPTGRYTAGASDNLGKGMWSYEVSGGATVYLDERRSLSVATTAYWETHTKKEGSVSLGGITLTDVKVGDLLTLEGGVGKAIFHGAGNIGMAYYAQWKVTPDEVTLPVPIPGAGPDLAKHRVYGFGPEVTIPIATKTKIVSFVNVRYLWETGTRIKTQGQSLLVTATVPLGGIRIPGR